MNEFIELSIIYPITLINNKLMSLILKIIPS